MFDVVNSASVGNKIGNTDKVMTESIVVKGDPVSDRVGKVDRSMTDSVIEDGALVGDKVGKLRKGASSNEIPSLLFDSLLAVKAKLWNTEEGDSTSLSIDVDQQPVDKKSAKDDDAAVPTHLWLKWLNEGDSKVIMAEQWDKFIPVL